MLQITYAVAGHTHSPRGEDRGLIVVKLSGWDSPPRHHPRSRGHMTHVQRQLGRFRPQRNFNNTAVPKLNVLKALFKNFWHLITRLKEALKVINGNVDY